MNKGKLEPKVRKCIFLGYGEGVRKRVYVVSPYSKSFSFLISTNVTLDEAIMMNPRKKPFDTKKQHRCEREKWGSCLKLEEL